MSDEATRWKIAQKIVSWEARRDSQGHIRLFRLSPADRGGRYEYAGINTRFHPKALNQIVELVDEEKHAQAEKAATEYIAQYTDVVANWGAIPAVEAFLRDTAFSRGPTGAAKVLQIALGVPRDGRVGPQTRSAIKREQANPEQLLRNLHRARREYELIVAPPRGPRAAFWKGLNNRWDNALAFSQTLL